MVLRHVEAVFQQKTLDRRHVRCRPAAEHLAVHEVRGHQFKHFLVQVAAITGPRLTQPMLFADKMQAEVIDTRGHVFQLAVIDDVLGRAGAVHKHHVDIGVGVIEPARHGHHRRDADATAKVENLRVGEIDGIEQPDRPVHGQFLTLTERVMQVVGDLATRYAFDGDRKAVGHRR